MTYFTNSLVVLAFIAIMVPPAFSQEEKPIQLSLFSPVQIFPEETPIAGLRLSLLYGKNSSVVGLDWGLVSHTTAGISMGWQTGFIGINDADFVGFQNSWANITKGSFEGLQFGLVNHANHASGIQIGFINYSVTLHGIQIGLVNIIKQGGQFPVFPIVNWSF